MLAASFGTCLAVGSSSGSVTGITSPSTLCFKKSMFRITTITLAALVCSCTWDKSESDATRKHFSDNKADYLAALAMAKGSKTEDDLKNTYPTLCSQGISIQTGAMVVEFTPVGFYYVIVYASSKAGLESSDSMTDEGVVKADLGTGWYLVQRGFN